MLSKYLVVLICCLTPFFLNAQFGIKGGFNLSYVSGTEEIVTNKASKAGLQIMLFYRHFLEDERFAIVSGLKYIKKGAKFTYESYDIDGRLDYLELPILLSYNILEETIYINAGPEFGILSGASYEFTEDNSTEKIEINNLNRFRTLDIGLGVSFGISIDQYFLEMHQNVGLLPVDKDLIVNSQKINLNARNYNVEFCVGVYF